MGMWHMSISQIKRFCFASLWGLKIMNFSNVRLNNPTNYYEVTPYPTIFSSYKVIP